MNINTGILKPDIVEINIVCINYHNYRFPTSDIDTINNGEKSIRLLFKDGSCLDFSKKNIICIEYNTKEGLKK